MNNVTVDLGITLVQLAIAWTLKPTPVSCVLVGAKSPGQVADHVGASDVELDAEALERIETILTGTPKTSAE